MLEIWVFKVYGNFSRFMVVCDNVFRFSGDINIVEDFRKMKVLIYRKEDVILCF